MKTFKKNNKTKIQLIQPEPERYLFAVEWWAGGCAVFLFVFLEGFLFFFCFCCFCLVFSSFCMYKRNNPSNNKNTKPSRTTTNTKMQLIQPAPEKYLFAAEWWAGCPICFCVFLECFFFCFSFVFVVFA